MITKEEMERLSATRNGKKLLNYLLLQRQDEMNRILPGFTQYA